MRIGRFARPRRCWAQLPIALSVLCLSSTNPAAAGPVGPTPYLQTSDSPFSAFTFDYYYLEDFEDNLFNVPGVTKTISDIIGPGLAADSVDADDGSIDGSGNGGRSLFVAGAALTFTFNPEALGELPTHAGIVRTDGGSIATGAHILFEAFGPGMISLGSITTAFGDGNPNGATAEDRFFGWSDSNGILAIRIPSGVFEVDHLQFGASVPEPSTMELFGAFGLITVGLITSRVLTPTLCRSNRRKRESPDVQSSTEVTHV
jgi:hypothetical protein